jgi:hypothetical protein
VNLRGACMARTPKRPRDLVEEVLDERAQSLSLSPSEIEAGVAKLRQLFREVRGRVAAEGQADQLQVPAQSEMGQIRLRYEAVLRPGSYRLRLGDLTFRVILGEARRTSRVLIDAARELLNSGPGAWGIAPAAALATRSGAQDPSRVEIVQQAGPASGTVIADDTGEEPRVLVLVRGFPSDQPAPIVNLAEEAPGAESGRVIEVHPEISPERPARRPRGQQE